MSAVGNDKLTLLDLANRMGPDGKVQKSIIEILDTMQEGFADIPWIECNDGTQHETTVRTGIPEPTWRQLNYGVEQSKSETAQVKDSCGMLENYSTVDCALVEMSQDKNALLLSESKPILEGMTQEFMSTFFYGNTAVDKKKFMGLAPRFNSLSAENGENIINGEGDADANTSIWLLVFGDQSLTGIYPAGTKAGLSQKNLGEVTVYDGAGNPYQAERSHFKWKPGISLRDWRQVVRIANIDVDDLTKDAATGADLIDLLDQAIEQVHNISTGKAVFMANRKIRSFLRRQMKRFPGIMISLDEVSGKKVLSYDGIPFRRCDAILNNEANVE